MDHLARPIVVLTGLPGLYGVKYDSATACGLPLYLCSYKLVGSVTTPTIQIQTNYMLVRSHPLWDGIHDKGLNEEAIQTGKVPQPRDRGHGSQSRKATK